ncbi:MAG: cell division protein FtsX, partial [Paracoccaceae bacterium]
QRDRVVPPTGFTATLTLFTSAVMGFLVVFALALSLASSRLADHWSDALARSATLKISAPAEQLEQQVEKALAILNTTPGIEQATVLNLNDQRRLLEPWFGADVPIELLALPALIDIREEKKGFDSENLRLRLVADVPGAVLDDHTRWRRPLVVAAERLSALGLFSILLMTGASAAMITLAARAAMSANAQVISVLRLIGAKDAYIAAAFVRRFSLRAFSGAAIGSLCGAVVFFFLTGEQDDLSILTGIGFQGLEWLWLFLIPPVFGGVALLATQRAAQKVLGMLS